MRGEARRKCLALPQASVVVNIMAQPPSRPNRFCHNLKVGAVLLCVVSMLAVLCSFFLPPVIVNECAFTPSFFRGRVIDQHGTPVAGATISIQVHDMDLSWYEVTSNSSGNFYLWRVMGLGFDAHAFDGQRKGYYAMPHNLSGIGSSISFKFCVEKIDRENENITNSRHLVLRLWKSGNLENLVQAGIGGGRMPIWLPSRWA